MTRVIYISRLELTYPLGTPSFDNEMFYGLFTKYIFKMSRVNGDGHDTKREISREFTFYMFIAPYSNISWGIFVTCPIHFGTVYGGRNVKTAWNSEYFDSTNSNLFVGPLNRS